MANWSNPTLSSLYTDFLNELKARDEDLAKQFDGQTVSNLFTGTIRWNSTANRWQKWSGTAWAELTSTYALTGLSTTGNASIGGTLSVTGSTALATATATTPATADNSTAIATTAYVRAQGYAPLASPTLTGTPAAPTAAVDTNTTQLATTAFVVSQASTATPLINGTAAAGTSLRYARQDHVHPTDTTRAALASPTFTGTPAAPTAAADTNTTQLATTAFVLGQAASTAPGMAGTAAVGTSLRYARQDHIHPTDTTRAPLASPGFTGTPTAPSAAAGTNTTQLATTAFVRSELSSGATALSAPAFIATGSTVPTNGIFLPSTNTLGIATATNEQLRIDSSGSILIGTTANRAIASAGTSPILYEGLGLSLALVANLTTTVGPIISFGKSRSVSTPGNTIVADGDILGQLRFAGADGVDLQTIGAQITAQVDGTPAANDIPSRIGFATAASGAGAPTERMRIASNGSISTVVPNGSLLYPAFMARAWVNFNGGGTVTIRDNGNVSSITDNGVGAYTVNFTTALSSTNYALIATCGDSASNYLVAQRRTTTGLTTSAVPIQTLTQNSGNPAAVDPNLVSVAIFI